MRRFTLTADHITLLRCAYVRWEDCETGAPAIDCKRPYGNSWVEMDIARKLGWDVFLDQFEEPYLSKDQADRATELHRETETALQVILAKGTFQMGTYVADDYRDNWRLDAAERGDHA